MVRDITGPALFSLAGQCALVTGGGTGIGACVAQGLVDAGARVVIAGRRRLEPLEQMALTINSVAGTECCFPLACDVSAFDAAGEIVAATERLAGAPPCILLNNAGVNVRQPAEALTAEHWRESLDLMLAAPFALARACAPGMADAKYGRIVSTASLQSTLAFADSIPYAAAKSGALGLTRALAEAYSPRHGYEGITCNAIAPGFVETELTAKVFTDGERANALAGRTIAGRNSVPTDLVGTAAFLCSPASAYVNGQLINVDGGFTSLGLP